MLADIIKEAMDNTLVGSEKWSALMGLKIKADLFEKTFYPIMTPEDYAKEEKAMLIEYGKIMGEE